MLFFLINIYSPTVGHERLNFFNILSGVLKKMFLVKDMLFIGGTGNCTVNFTEDRKH